MESEPRRATATIYRFPLGGRAALEHDERRKKAAILVPTPNFSGGWYHEVAIREARDADATPRN